jgi:hypothetical protein
LRVINIRRLGADEYFVPLLTAHTAIKFFDLAQGTRLAPKQEMSIALRTSDRVPNEVELHIPERNRLVHATVRRVTCRSTTLVHCCFSIRADARCRKNVVVRSFVFF